MIAKSSSLFLALIFLTSSLAAQTALPEEVSDSLWSVWEDEEAPDSSRLQAMHRIAWDGYLYTQPDSAFHYAQLQYELAEKKDMKREMADALNIQGVSHYFRSDYDEALKYYSRCLRIKQELGDKRLVAGTLNNMGLIYDEKGNYAKAIEYYTRSLRIKEDIGDEKGVASSLNNIGVIHENQEEFARALDHYKRSLRILEELGKEKDIASSLNNIGNVHFKKGEYEEALEHYERSLSIRERIGDDKGMANSMHNIGGVYEEKGELEKAMENYRSSLELYEQLQHKKGISTSLNSIGGVHAIRKDHGKAISQSQRALNIARELGAAEEIRDAAQALYRSYKALGREGKALEMYELHISTRDSIQSEKNQREVIRQRYKYQYEKEKAEDSIRAAEARRTLNAQLEVQDARLERERMQRYTLYGGVGLLFLFGGLLYQRFRVIRKHKGIIQEKKEEVDLAYQALEEKNKEVMDSIAYAKRIQNAILPAEERIDELLPDRFILYKPKDIVAGDFYWVQAFEGKSFFAVADCTGHGVPGAMVSMVCKNALDRSVREYGLTDPGAILDRTRELVVSELEEGEEGVKDGMDIALCVLDGKTLSYAGAHNPLLIVREGADEKPLEAQLRSEPEPILDEDSDARLIQVKSDKQPIGKYRQASPFNTHRIELQKEDRVYIFTDGFPDQFGGPKGKKFKVNNFKRTLLSLRNEGMKEQLEQLDKVFEDWKGDMDQVDDVCVMGVRIA